MKAKQYLDRYVSTAARPFATVVISAGKRFTHMPLQEEQQIHEDESGDTTVFIHIDVEAMPPDRVGEHNCLEGLVCVDHPGEAAHHNDCYGPNTDCQYLGCKSSILAGC